jgi:hypothetical protein
VAELQKMPRGIPYLTFLIPVVKPVNELVEGIMIMATVWYGVKMVLLP